MVQTFMLKMIVLYVGLELMALSTYVLAGFLRQDKKSNEAAMKYLRAVDKVAYIRFASVYREFTDAGELIDEVSQAIKESQTKDQPELFDS